MTAAQMKRMAQLVSDLIYWNACESCGAVGGLCTRVVNIGVENDEMQYKCGVTNARTRRREDLVARDMVYDRGEGVWMPNDKYRIANGLADDDECDVCEHPRFEHDEKGCVAFGTGEGGPGCHCSGFKEPS